MERQSCEGGLSMAISQLDESKVEDFADKVVGTLNAGSLALMTSIGHRTGLFDVMSGQPPLTSETLARRAGLQERYVREWLGAMVVGGFVTVDADSAEYSLPPEHAACLTRQAAPNNLAAFSQYISVLGQVEDQIVSCFVHGGGVPYSAYPRFQEVMAEDSGQTVLPALLDSILPLVPGLVARLERGIDVVDVGCGSGRAMALLAETFPKSRFVGFDISEEGVSAANARAADAGLANLRFEVRDVAQMDDAERFDLVTAFDAIHDQARPREVLAGIRRALRRDGVFLMQDIAASSHVHENVEHPLGPFLYTISTMHCMTVSLAQDGEGLGATWGHQKAHELLGEAGFADVERHQLPHDLQNDFYVARPA
jgi:SAM-dependent methyltransferase